VATINLLFWRTIYSIKTKKQKGKDNKTTRQQKKRTKRVYKKGVKKGIQKGGQKGIQNRSPFFDLNDEHLFM
jgi:hypothetical protein